MSHDELHEDHTKPPTELLFTKEELIFAGVLAMTSHAMLIQKAFRSFRMYRTSKENWSFTALVFRSCSSKKDPKSVCNGKWSPCKSNNTGRLRRGFNPNPSGTSCCRICCPLYCTCTTMRRYVLKHPATVFGFHADKLTVMLLFTCQSKVLSMFNSNSAKFVEKKLLN
jgi:hypothetical protein